MALNADAEARIRNNLEALRDGKRVKPVSVGTLTAAQLAVINNYREKKHQLPPIEADVVFFGSHIYERRIATDGYSIDDVIDQIQSAFRDTSRVINGTMTALRNPTNRADRYGNSVRDEVVLECSRKYPKAELYSVVPRGDNTKPVDKKEAATKVTAPTAKT
jgi:hypothetical protein